MDRPHILHTDWVELVREQAELLLSYLDTGKHDRDFIQSHAMLIAQLCEGDPDLGPADEPA